MASKVIENTSPEVMAMAEASAGKKEKNKSKRIKRANKTVKQRRRK